MFEIEKKFELTDDQRERLIAGAVFESEVVNTDVYFDTPDFRLVRKLWWLRFRNGKVNLKISNPEDDGNFVDRFDEIEDESLVRDRLGVPADGDLAVQLTQAGYVPVIQIRSERKTYRDAEFRIDIDHADFGDFAYDIAEIELLVERKDQRADAVKKILEYAKKKNLPIGPVRGKGFEYLFRKQPDVYAIASQKLHFP